MNPFGRMWVFYFLASNALFAQASPADWAHPINADRPDLANSAETVGSAVFQLEGGLNRMTNPGGTGAILSVPLMLRAGLGESWEARFSTQGLQMADRGGPLTGPQDLGVGIKWAFYHEEGAVLAAMGLLAQTSLQDSGKGLGWTNNCLALAADLQLHGETGLTLNLGFDPGSSLETDPKSWSWAASFGFPFSRSWSGYFERSGIIPEAGDSTLGLDGGVKFLPSPDVQLDASAGLFQAGNQTQTVLSLGCSFRVGPEKADSNPSSLLK